MSTAIYEHRTPTANKYENLAGYMKNNPGTWVKVRTANTRNASAVAAHQIKTGRLAAFRPEGTYDAYSEGNDVVARYVGDN